MNLQLESADELHFIEKPTYTCLDAPQIFALKYCFCPRKRAGVRSNPFRECTGPIFGTMTIMTRKHGWSGRCSWQLMNLNWKTAPQFPTDVMRISMSSMRTCDARCTLYV